jgi:hypothetical protein
MLKLKDLFTGRKPTVSELATSELYECEVALLAALANLEHAQSNVDYLTNRVARLRRNAILSNNKTEPKLN